MSLPIVAIVGRPNVGKSSLFNVVARRRISIVEPTPGVTRDRVSAICDIDESYFELVDTGGHGIVDRDDLTSHVERQIQYAIEQAGFILFIVDARDGVTPLDRSTATLLKSHMDRVQLVANKVDAAHLGYEAGEFLKLGFGDPIVVSAVTGHGRAELLQRIKEFVSQYKSPPPADPTMKIVLVGRRNAGKSSFINAIAGEERVIVSEVPGTTRDSIDVRFEKDGRTMIAIDTAGVRKKRKIADDIEFYALNRAINSIHRADVVLFMIDATEPVSQVDKKLARLICDAYKPCIIVVNKWDLAKGRADAEDYGEYLHKVLPEIRYAPLAFTTASEGRNIQPTIDLSTELFKQTRMRVGTGRLNQALKEAIATQAPRPKRGRKAPKILYATQVATQPPTIVVFVNGTHLVTQSYERFLLNRFREQLPFDEVPIRLVFRSRRGTYNDHGSGGLAPSDQGSRSQRANG